jgi:LacI family transcriptional regulator
VGRLLKEQPALGAIYNVGGGNAGLVEAMRGAGRAGDLLLVGHETNAITVPLLREGSMDFAIAQDPAVLLSEAFRHAVGSEAPARDSVLLDFGVFTRFNIPSFGSPAPSPLS